MNHEIKQIPITELTKIKDFVNDTPTESDDAAYLSDGEILDHVMEKITQLITPDPYIDDWAKQRFINKTYNQSTTHQITTTNIKPFAKTKVIKEPQSYDYESMRNRLAENDAINYAFAQEKGEQDLYKIIREGIIGYNNMTDEELVSIHKTVFGYVDYKTINHTPNELHN